MKKGKLKVSFTDGFGDTNENYYEIYELSLQGQIYYIEKNYKNGDIEYPEAECKIYSNSDYLDNLTTHFTNGNTATIEWVEAFAEVSYEKEYYTKAEIDEIVKDTGWVDVTLDSNFERYSENYAPLQVRKIGKVVYLRGSVKPLEAFTPTNDVSHRIGLMPSGYAPTSYPVILVCQGSISNRFALWISPNRGLYISRYTNDDVQQHEVPAGSWLNCYGSWING